VSRSYTIGQLAALVGVHVETVRYYHRRELIPEPERLRGRTRRYSTADAQRLRFIKSAQRLGFSLTEIKSLLHLLTSVSCSKTRRIAEAKLESMDQRIRALQELRDEFARLLRACRDNADESRCPIIDHLAR
jgi:MerR family mercuric resistance operon transcriptional regulator